MQTLPVAYSTTNYSMVVTYLNTVDNYVFNVFSTTDKTSSNYRIVQRTASGKSTDQACYNCICIGF